MDNLAKVFEKAKKKAVEFKNTNIVIAGIEVNVDMYKIPLSVYLDFINASISEIKTEEGIVVRNNSNAINEFVNLTNYYLCKPGSRENLFASIDVKSHGFEDMVHLVDNVFESLEEIMAITEQLFEYSDFMDQQSEKKKQVDDIKN